MKLLLKNSLAETVDAINEALFFGKDIPPEQTKEISLWLASRQGAPGSYWGMIAPTPKDFKTGIKVFTGEPVTTRAGTSHILGEESSKILLRLGVKNKAVLNALDKSNKGFETAMKRAVAAGYYDGSYCCGKCTAAFWQNLAAGGLKYQERRLDKGMEYLYKFRDGKGRWRRMPFYYTLLALNDIDSPLAKKELEYTAPGLEKLLKRFNDKDKYGKRRKKLVEQILAKT
jgi:hypothetical protein